MTNQTTRKMAVLMLASICSALVPQIGTAFAQNPYTICIGDLCHSPSYINLGCSFALRRSAELEGLHKGVLVSYPPPTAFIGALSLLPPFGPLGCTRCAREIWDFTTPAGRGGTRRMLWGQGNA